MEIASKSYRYRIFTIPFFLLLNCLSFFDVYGIEVSGSVSGDWTLPNSPYIVTADATVPDGESLTIQPGVEIKFRTGSADLFVDGVLNAMGTAAFPFLSPPKIRTRHLCNGDLSFSVIRMERKCRVSNIVTFLMEVGSVVK